MQMENFSEIIKKSRELAALIQESEIYSNLSEARKKSDSDEELQRLISEFNLVRMNLDNEAVKEDRNEELVRKYNFDLRKIYDTVMANENMMLFNEAKEEADSLISKINMILSGALNGEDPESIDISSSCSGDCGSCGGCH